MDLWQSNEGFTHVKEAAGMLQYELTGVWFVLTVIYINVELISLETEEDRMFTRFQSCQSHDSIWNKGLTLTQVTKQCPTSSGSCS